MLPLLIPIENQVRELDPKLLLATCAAKRGLPSYIGYRTEMDIIISKLPRSIYLAKSFTHRSDKMFRILSKLGHIICAWDEEALVHYPPDIYFKRRLSPIAISYISYLFSWGQENEELFRAYPSFPESLPIYKVGNPRLDMLRKEFNYYYENEIKEIKNNYGKFILFNTNFGNVNAHLPIHNLFINKDENGNYKNMGRGSTGMGKEFSEGRAKFKQAIFEKYLKLVSYVADKFQDTTIIIRPHPVESQTSYFELASQFNNIKVIREGNVIPWIKASTALIHSGCTTGIEAYLSGKPSIAYIPVTDSRYGYDAIVPDQLSHQCKNEKEVTSAIQSLMKNHSLSIDSSILEKYIEFDKNTLCSNKIMDVIEQIQHENKQATQSIHNFQGWLLANKRRLIKRVKGLSPKSKYNNSFQEVRFPSLDEKSLQAKIDRFARVIGSESSISIKQIYPHIFLVQ